MPIRLIISILKEVQRANKVHHGIAFALKNFPGSHLVVGMFGILKGMFYGCDGFRFWNPFGTGFGQISGEISGQNQSGNWVV